MVVYKSKTKASAMRIAARFRKKGFRASVHNPKGKGYAVSVTRKKKRR